MSKKVLILDSDHTVRNMVRYILSAEDYEVIEAGGAEEVFAKLNGGARPDLMVVGVNIDEQGCVALLKAVRTIPGYDHIPILMLAPERTLYKQMEWKDAGATCWIIKPFTAEQFLKMVEMVIF